MTDVNDPIDMSGTNDPVLPGSTIGILGSGQLGRMITIAARRMGYRVHTLSPEVDSPTGHGRPTPRSGSSSRGEADRGSGRPMARSYPVVRLTIR